LTPLYFRDTMSIHHVGEGTGMEKDVQFAFRVDSDLRERFVRICREMDRPAGQVLREYMRGFIEQHDDSGIPEIKAVNKNHRKKNRIST